MNLNRYEFPAVLIAREKHGTRHFAASTPGELFSSALSLLTERLSDYWYPEPDPSPDPPSFEHAEEVPQEFRQQAARLLREHTTQLQEDQHEARQLRKIESAVQEQDGFMALQLLLARSGSYQYEDVEVVPLEGSSEDALSWTLAQHNLWVEDLELWQYLPAAVLLRGPKKIRAEVDVMIMESWCAKLRGEKPLLPAGTKVLIDGKIEGEVNSEVVADGSRWKVGIEGRIRLIDCRRVRRVDDDV